MNPANRSRPAGDSRVPGLRGVLKVDIIESPSWGGGVVDVPMHGVVVFGVRVVVDTRVRFREKDFF